MSDLRLHSLLPIDRCMVTEAKGCEELVSCRVAAATRPGIKSATSSSQIRH